MMKFNWRPDLGAEQDETPNVGVVKLGDGYENRLPKGINSQASQWSVTFTKGLLEHKAIRAFLKQHGASKAFEWTDPTGEVGFYVCRSWKSKQEGFGVFSVSGTFEQVFE